MPNTRWSVVLNARNGLPRQAEHALGVLCESYWFPIYAFIRRRGHPPHEAQDLTQGFFANLLERAWLENVSPEKGRFRTYILHCLTHYLTNEWKREQGPQRRPAGGIVRLETGDAELRYAYEPADDATPEKVFQRRWVAAVVEQAKDRLRAECAETRKLPLFENVEMVLGDRMEQGAIAELAALLGVKEVALRVAIHRLRRRFGELLRAVVAETLANPEDVDTEIRSLFSAWS